MYYLLRDAHYTGVVLGTIDIDRLLSQIRIDKGRMVVGKGGIAATEGLMVSRALMYSSVYYHKTVRIAEMMLTKAAEISGADLSELYLMNDGMFINHIISTGGKASDLARKVMNRRLYKNAYVMQTTNLSDDAKAELAKHTGYAGRKALEAEIAHEAGLEDHEVVIDMPSRPTLLSSVKIGKTDVYIIDDDGRMKPISAIRLHKALQSREIFDWAITVSAPSEHAERVMKASGEYYPLMTPTGLSLATLPLIRPRDDGDDLFHVLVCLRGLLPPIPSEPLEDYAVLLHISLDIRCSDISGPLWTSFCRHRGSWSRS